MLEEGYEQMCLSQTNMFKLIQCVHTSQTKKKCTLWTKFIYYHKKKNYFYDEMHQFKCSMNVNGKPSAGTYSVVLNLTVAF